MNISGKNSSLAHNLTSKSRTQDVWQENVTFEDLNLSPFVLQGLKASGFVKPSPIQLKSIPIGKCGFDLVVQAKSGTGKTCVFAVIILENVLTNVKSLQSVVLAPTREIAVQICDVINSIGQRFVDLKCHSFIGGTPLGEDIKKLEHCHVAVATPGRMQQLIKEGLINVERVRLFVLDEADKLLEDFKVVINFIYKSLPTTKQMLTLSATYTESLAKMITNYMQSPLFARLNSHDPVLLGVHQYYVSIPFHLNQHKVFLDKLDLVSKLFQTISFKQCLVFCNYQNRSQSLSEKLFEKGWSCEFINGLMQQKDRLNTISNLKNYKCRILISTDLTSRGIDAENVDLVINFDLPQDYETYLHRIGRAGRYGSHSACITIVSQGKEWEQLNCFIKLCSTLIYQLPNPVPQNLTIDYVPVDLPSTVSADSDEGDSDDVIAVSQNHDNTVSLNGGNQINVDVKNDDITVSRDDYENMTNTCNYNLTSTSENIVKNIVRNALYNNDNNNNNHNNNTNHKNDYKNYGVKDSSKASDNNENDDANNNNNNNNKIVDNEDNSVTNNNVTTTDGKDNILTSLLPGITRSSDWSHNPHPSSSLLSTKSSAPPPPALSSQPTILMSQPTTTIPNHHQIMSLLAYDHRCQLHLKSSNKPINCYITNSINNFNISYKNSNSDSGNISNNNHDKFDHGNSCNTSNVNVLQFVKDEKLKCYHQKPQLLKMLMSSNLESSDVLDKMQQLMSSLHSTSKTSSDNNDNNINNLNDDNEHTNDKKLPFIDNIAIKSTDDNDKKHVQTSKECTKRTYTKEDLLRVRDQVWNSPNVTEDFKFLNFKLITRYNLLRRNTAMFSTPHDIDNLMPNSNMSYSDTKNNNKNDNNLYGNQKSTFSDDTTLNNITSNDTNEQNMQPIENHSNITETIHSAPDSSTKEIKPACCSFDKHIVDSHSELIQNNKRLCSENDNLECNTINFVNSGNISSCKQTKTCSSDICVKNVDELLLYDGDSNDDEDDDSDEDEDLMQEFFLQKNLKNFEYSTFSAKTENNNVDEEEDGNEGICEHDSDDNDDDSDSELNLNKDYIDPTTNYNENDEKYEDYDEDADYDEDNQQDDDEVDNYDPNNDGGNNRQPAKIQNNSHNSSIYNIPTSDSHKTANNSHKTKNTTMAHGTSNHKHSYDKALAEFYLTSYNMHMQQAEYYRNMYNNLTGGWQADTSLKVQMDYAEHLIKNFKQFNEFGKGDDNDDSDNDDSDNDEDDEEYDIEDIDDCVDNVDEYDDDVDGDYNNGGYYN